MGTKATGRSVVGSRRHWPAVADLGAHRINHQGCVRSSVGESPSLLSWLSQVRFLPGAPTLTRLSCQRRSPTAKKAGARKSGELETIRGRGKEQGYLYRQATGARGGFKSC